jgi:cytochrome c oxidase subunit 1
VFNFAEIPTVVGGPYEYGVPGAVHAVFKEKAAAASASPAPAGGGGAPPPNE